MEINVKIIINNIYYLAKTKKIKIGDLESFAGVSSGYLSKLSKEKVTTIPGTEVLYKISKKLGVTLDSLISIDYSSADPTELYIYKFIDRLIKKTDLMEIDWKMESTEKIEKNHSDIHPLYHYNFRNELVYKSLFYDDIPGVIAYPLGNIYSFEFKDTKYFLIRINALFENQNHIGFEMYTYKDFEVKKLYYSEVNDDDSKLNILYDSVINYLVKPKIDDDTKKTIDLFMNEFDD